ncbi:MAG: ABC transporter permease subunit [Planctomycetota bacterium]
MSGRGRPRSDHATSPHVRGLLPGWLMSFALGLCLVMIAGLIVLIAAQGAATFWPRPIDRVVLADSGEELIGVPVREEPDEAGGVRRLYRVGNRDLGNAPFVWVDLDQVDAAERDPDLVLVERSQWGVFLGTFESIVTPEGESSRYESLGNAISAGRDRREAMNRLRAGPISDVNRAIEQTRRDIAEARFAMENQGRRGLSVPLWSLAVVVTLALGIGAGVAWRRRGGLGKVLAVAAALAGLLVVLERPAPSDEDRTARAAERLTELDAEQAGLSERFAALSSELRALDAQDSRFRVVFRAASGRFAPESQGEPDTPMRLSQVVRVVRPNELSTGESLGVYLSRWREFLLSDPREANTEGGVFPVIVGTVVVTLLLTVAVVPLGVLAALFIREYAKQGILISLLRIAINNLAGVPSIVYGVFGLGFFCYTVGGFIDVGPSDAIRLPPAGWWVVGVVCAACIAAALLLGGGRQGAGGSPGSGKHRAAAGLVWAGAVVALIVMLATSPYFDGFFRVKMLDGEPTFGSAGMLWASLTLALLTLPVVIVSTEEAIAAVPPSLREGSYGCGASRWQTIRRVVLPGALPGVMTGAILAVARGAGEVAPLMVVGAVKLAPDLPIDDRPPFIFLDRSFMHLGFHIFDLGFQSPDSEAARGMVWTTTLLLIVLVITMNLAAIVLRGRLRRRLAGGHF